MIFGMGPDRPVPEVTLYGVLHHFPKLLHRVTLRGDRMAQSYGAKSAVRILGDFKNDFGIHP